MPKYKVYKVITGFVEADSPVSARRKFTDALLNALDREISNDLDIDVFYAHLESYFDLDEIISDESVVLIKNEEVSNG